MDSSNSGYMPFCSEPFLKRHSSFHKPLGDTVSPLLALKGQPSSSPFYPFLWTIQPQLMSRLSLRKLTRSIHVDLFFTLAIAYNNQLCRCVMLVCKFRWVSAHLIQNLQELCDDEIILQHSFSTLLYWQLHKKLNISGHSGISVYQASFTFWQDMVLYVAKWWKFLSSFRQ